MANQIVTVNTSQVLAAAPSTLQRTGAMISQGGTTLDTDASLLITQQSDLTAILQGPLALSGLVYSTGTVTATAAAALPFADAAQFTVTIAGATPAAYNGTFAATVTGANTFTYTLGSDPGAETVPGTWQPYSAIELLNMYSTFSAQGTSLSVYVLELGATTAAQGIAALDAYIGEQVTQPYYIYLVPAAWADDETYLAFVGDFASDDARTYFATTLSLDNYTNYTTMAPKSVIGLIPSPNAPTTEFPNASDFFRALKYNPSAAAPVTPFAFSYLFGVTPYPLFGNGSTLAALKAAFVNYVGTGAEGGISNSCLFWGTTMDGRDFSYWYSVDWVQINLDLQTTNAVINGSNSTPLYYNQSGINQLQAVAAGVMTSGTSFGLVYGTVIQTQLAPQDLAEALDNGTYAGYTVVNAVPFNTYVAAAPDDYATGTYAGLTVSYSPNRGFKSIIYTLQITDIVAT